MCGAISRIYSSYHLLSLFIFFLSLSHTHNDIYWHKSLKRSSKATVFQDFLESWLQSPSKLSHKRKILTQFPRNKGKIKHFTSKPKKQHEIFPIFYHFNDLLSQIHLFSNLFWFFLNRCQFFITILLLKKKVSFSFLLSNNSRRKKFFFVYISYHHAINK